MQINNIISNNSNNININNDNDSNNIYFCLFIY